MLSIFYFKMSEFANNFNFSFKNSPAPCTRDRVPFW